MTERGHSPSAAGQGDHASEPKEQQPVSHKSPSRAQTTTAADEGSQHPPPTGARLAVVMVAILLALFLVALDRTILATAVPQIANQFHALDDINWYASAYLLTSCATQLSWGKVFSAHSTKLVLLVAVSLFEVGSALCGAAPSSTAFIVGRAIAGVGSAGIFSGVTVVIAQIVPLQKRPIYVGLMGSIFGVSSIVGPLLGGALTDRVTWRWCFYINLPIGGFTLVVLCLFLSVPRSRGSPRRRPWRDQLVRLDPIGSLLFLPSVVCFLLALQWGGSSYPWGNGRIVALFVVAGVLAIAFGAVQIWRQEDATVPPRIVRQRSVLSGTVFALCVGGAMISTLYTLALWFQAVQQTSAVQSGIDTIPMVLALVVGSVASGAVITRTGYYVPWMYVATVLMATGAGLMTTFDVDTRHPAWIGYQVLFGLGVGTGMQQASLAAQTVLAMKDVSVGVSLMFFAQSLGGALFVAIAQALFLDHLSARLPAVPGLDVASVLAAGARNLADVVPADRLPDVLRIYNRALRRSFIVSLAVACLMILPTMAMEWRTVKKKNPPKNEKAADSAA
ncbi:hypothetical protein VTO42DRAFT_2113 [Malbranchea cinnamomea]